MNRIRTIALCALVLVIGIAACGRMNPAATHGTGVPTDGHQRRAVLQRSNGITIYASAADASQRIVGVMRVKVMNGNSRESWRPLRMARSLAEDTIVSVREVFRIVPASAAVDLARWDRLLSASNFEVVVTPDKTNPPDVQPCCSCCWRKTDGGCGATWGCIKKMYDN